jgi:ankyrin repeat protein
MSLERKNDAANELGVALIEAAKANQLNIVKNLITAKASLSCHAIKDGNTAVHWAVINQNLEMLDALIEAKAPLDSTNRDNDSPLHLAAFGRNPEIIKKLLENNESASLVNKKNETAIEVAAYNNRWTNVEAFVDAHPNIDRTDSARYGHALLLAVEHNKTGLVKKLVRTNADRTWHKTSTDNYPLHLAVINNNPQMIQILLNAGCDASSVNKEGKTAIQIATANRLWNCIKMFAEKEDKDDKCRYGDALYEAVRHNKTELVRLLVKAKASLIWVDTTTEEYPLHIAVRNNNPAIIRILRQGGADITLKNKKGETALKLATDNKNWSCVNAFTDSSEEQEQKITSPEITVPVLEVEEKENTSVSLPLAKSKKMELTDTITLALQGDANAIIKMATYYQRKNELGRAMLFSCLAAVWGLPSESKKNHDYITHLIPTKWRWSRTRINNCIAMQGFLQDCLSARDYPHYLIRLKEEYKLENDPIALILLALEKAVEAAPPALFAQDPGLIKAKAKLDESIKAIMYYELGYSTEQINQWMENKRLVVSNLLKEDKQKEIEKSPEPVQRVEKEKAQQHVVLFKRGEPKPAVTTASHPAALFTHHGNPEKQISSHNTDNNKKQVLIS